MASSSAVSSVSVQSPPSCSSSLLLVVDVNAHNYHSYFADDAMGLRLARKELKTVRKFARDNGEDEQLLFIQRVAAGTQFDLRNGPHDRVS